MKPHTSDAPDLSYWTAYDFRMAERDARAARRAYVYAMIARMWQRIKDSRAHAGTVTEP